MDAPQLAQVHEFMDRSQAGSPADPDDLPRAVATAQSIGSLLVMDGLTFDDSLLLMTGPR